MTDFNQLAAPRFPLALLLFERASGLNLFGGPLVEVPPPGVPVKTVTGNVAAVPKSLAPSVTSRVFELT